MVRIEQDDPLGLLAAGRSWTRNLEEKRKRVDSAESGHILSWPHTPPHGRKWDPAATRAVVFSVQRWSNKVRPRGGLFPQPALPLEILSRAEVMPGLSHNSVPERDCTAK